MMANPTPRSERRYMGPYLSDLPGIKIFVKCDQCGIQYQWDGIALLDRLKEDGNLPTIIGEIKKAIGCDVALKHRFAFDPQCRLVYDVDKMDRLNPGMKHQAG